MTPRPHFWFSLACLVGVLAAAAGGFILLGPRPEHLGGALDVSALPTLNASLNGCAALLLLLGAFFARRGLLTAHRRTMLAAFTVSAGFLTSYALYHAIKPSPTPYLGPARGLYLSVLISHIVLAATVPPLALLTLHRGWRGQRLKHRRLARVALPIWLYVSVTGVVIYLMLYG